ncbi:MAG TPA: hypothetical protein VGO80_00350 [Solirubrobacteraceae bacterium]|jgi:hypothetical protein|nr:hypothetical protein [Solirubrobacteraceae bacterium]
MALRSLAGDGVHITPLVPDRDFRRRPTAVAEPFSIDRLRDVALADVAADFGAQVVTSEIAFVAPA